MAKNQIPTFAAWAVAAVAAAFFLPAAVSGARDVKAATNKGFVVQGRVFCDTCRAGFETPKSTYIAGAKVRLECRSRTTGAKTCSFDGVTDRSGTYNILVADEHEHETCEAVLVSSPVKGCAKTLEGRERARVFLTNNNGIASTKRFANSLGFQRDIALAGCAQLLKMYQQYENEV
ncbi:pollen-specific protein C13 [Elaeis guineensis]|uniref:Pollen-specific protein C13 n=1 Tax=Elaeis guineensis var. tenera TaxID=51953 RepID=A0A6I9QMA9_ELAGV|nr:pollen-specific protein C13 [Elaeis guineensis]